jgi:hypothetical protein
MIAQPVAPVHATPAPPRIMIVLSDAFRQDDHRSRAEADMVARAQQWAY